MSLSEFSMIKEYLISKLLPLTGEALDDLALKKGASILTIMKGHDQPWSGYTFDTVYSEFLEQAPAWKEMSPDVAVFFRNPKYAMHEHLMCLRHQTTGNCGAHASVQLLHYLMDLRSDGSVNVGSVDIAAHMKLNALYGKELLNYLTGKRHTKPLYFLASLGSLNKQLFQGFGFNTPYADAANIDGNRRTAALMMRLLEEFPGMVTNFTVSDAFLKSPLISFSGVPVFTDEGAHAMVILGARRSGEDYFFMLQNWHIRKQFIEVSAEYLAHCDAHVHFVRPTQVITLAHTTPLTTYEATECAINDSDDEEENEG